MGFLSRFIAGAGEGMASVGKENLQNINREESLLKLEEVRAERARDAEERANQFKAAERVAGQEFSRGERALDRASNEAVARERKKDPTEKSLGIVDNGDGTRSVVYADGTSKLVTDKNSGEPSIGKNKEDKKALDREIEKLETHKQNLIRDRLAAAKAARPEYDTPIAELDRQIANIKRGGVGAPVDMQMVQPSPFDLSGPATGPLTSGEPSGEATPQTTTKPKLKQIGTSGGKPVYEDENGNRVW